MQCETAQQFNQCQMELSIGKEEVVKFPRRGGWSFFEWFVRGSETGLIK